MKIIIYWKEAESKDLHNKVKSSLEELWLNEFISLEESKDESIKKEFSIKKEPALIIEEEEIEFKDLIFEWVIPSEDEIKSMLVSIIGWDWWWCGDSCGSSGWWCWSWCSC